MQLWEDGEGGRGVSGREGRGGVEGWRGVCVCVWGGGGSL